MPKSLVRKVTDNGNEGFPKILKYHVMPQANVSSNYNKYYVLKCQVHPNERYHIFTHYGRLGISNIFGVRDTANGQPIYDEQVAMNELEHIHEKKLHEKLAKDKGTDQKIQESYVANIALGRYYETYNAMPQGTPKGYDSIWVKAGRSLYNDELVVPYLEQ